MPFLVSAYGQIQPMGRYNFNQLTEKCPSSTYIFVAIAAICDDYNHVLFMEFEERARALGKLVVYTNIANLFKHKQD